jgi:class 3 adenylate cyclase
MALSAGRRLGPYEILAPLGAGGMGEVYRARDPRLGRDVAVKVLRDATSGDPDRLRRFEQEAKAAGALNHPNLLSVYDVGAHEGVPYLVFELLQGTTLRDLLGPEPLSIRKAVDYGVQVARGLAAAHDKGIVHRDLKPENVFVTEDGRVKILDFGLAKLRPVPDALRSDVATASAITEAGTVLGTVGYMSPEQVSGHPADPRSDIFSFGSVLYEMLTGRRAFKGGTPVETMNAILKEEPGALSSASAALPTGVERVVRRCLEKRREDRFESAKDLAFALETALDDSTSPVTSASSSGVSIKTLLAMELVERTALMASLGDVRGAEILGLLESALRAASDRFGGLEADRGVWLFERPIDAVKFALQGQEAVSRLAKAEALALSVRTGIHLGEVLIGEGRVEGLAKATVERLCALAGTNQTLLTRTAFDLARRAARGDDALDDRVVWLSHGLRRVEGLDDSVETFEVGLKGLSLLAPPAGDTAATGAVARSPGWHHPRLWVGLAALAAVLVVAAVRSARRPESGLPAPSAATSSPSRPGSPEALDDDAAIRGVLEPVRSDARATAIADRVMQALGGAEAWNATRYLRFDFAVDSGGKTVASRAHTWDKSTGRYRLEAKTKPGPERPRKEGDPFVVLANVNTKDGSAYLKGRRLEGDEAKSYLDMAYSMWVNDTYWLLMPYKMKDPGVVLTYDGEEKKGAAAWDKVVLTFDNVGLTPKDKYWVYVNRATGLVDKWEYVLNGGPGPPMAFAWQGWTRHGSILLASDRVSQQDEASIHFPVLETPASLPDQVFTSPEAVSAR